VPPGSGVQITVGALRVRFLVEGDASGGSVTLFECEVPAQSRMPAPHSHDGFEETIYGLEGVTTWTVDGEAIEIGPGDAICIPRGSVHGFANHRATDAKFVAVASPGVFGPAYFREIAEVLSSDGPPDIAALAAVMRRHGLTPAAPSPS
jgi:quercetin dioxygenase-like cupin family protein